MATCVVSVICISLKMSGEIVAKTMDFVCFYYMKPVLIKLKIPFELDVGTIFLKQKTVEI